MNLRVTNGRTQEQSISSLPEDATESGVIEKRSNSDGSASGGDDSIERGDKSGASDSVKNARAEGERYFANTLKASLQTKALSSNPAKNGNADAAASSPVKTASASGKNGSSEKSSFYALIPKDRETVSDYNLLFAAAQTFYEKEGIKVSKAAIEEVVGQGRIFEKRDFKPDFVRDENGKPILDAEGNPQRAYLITIDEGAKRALLQFKPEAERITREAIPAVHDLTDREREYLVLKIFAEKYAKELPKEALAEVFTLENLGQAALEKILNAAAPGVGSMFGAATFAVVGAPELHFILKDIKRFTYAPTKPSDLDKAAKRLADLARMYAVMKITSKIDKGADRLSAAADGQIPRLSSKLKSPPPGFGPTAPAVVTAGGPQIDWRMPIDKPLAPAPPNGSPRPGNELPRGWIWGTGSKGEPNEAGGPLGKLDPVEATRRKDRDLNFDSNPVNEPLLAIDQEQLPRITDEQAQAFINKVNEWEASGKIVGDIDHLKQSLQSSDRATRIGTVGELLELQEEIAAGKILEYKGKERGTDQPTYEVKTRTEPFKSIENAQDWFNGRIKDANKQFKNQKSSGRFVLNLWESTTIGDKPITKETVRQFIKQALSKGSRGTNITEVVVKKNTGEIIYKGLGE